MSHYDPYFLPMTGADPDEPAVADLIASRICHDLISPLGAIGNGLELLQMSGVPDSPELALIRDSVEIANARVRLFRIAFGAATEDGRVSRGEIEHALISFTDRRMEIDWPTTPDLSRADARLVLLLLMCAETMMPHGGSVRVMLNPMSILMTADRFRADTAFVTALTQDTPTLPASIVHFQVARGVAVDLGRRIDVRSGSGTMALTAH